MRPAMQSHLAALGSPVTSGTALYEGDAEQLAGADAELSRTLHGPAPAHTATSKKTLRERLRRPLLILFPVMLAVAGAVYYLAEEPYVSTDDAFVYAARESINARVAGQVVEIAVKNNQ